MSDDLNSQIALASAGGGAWAGDKTGARRPPCSWNTYKTPLYMDFRLFKRPAGIEFDACGVNWQVHLSDGPRQVAEPAVILARSRVASGTRRS